ncbi:hypothetical protein AOG23_19960 [Rhizobium acidisoli]|nr:hypothetical protein AOG23_19960 [Rhizobium acidisoli]
MILIRHAIPKSQKSPAGTFSCAGHKEIRMYERYYLSTICREPDSGTPLLPYGGPDGQSFHGSLLLKAKIGMLQMRNNGIGIFLCAQVATKDCAGAFRPHPGKGFSMWISARPTFVPL